MRRVRVRKTPVHERCSLDAKGFKERIPDKDLVFAAIRLSSHFWSFSRSDFRKSGMSTYWALRVPIAARTSFRRSCAWPPLGHLKKIGMASGRIAR
eukprot:13884295-Alexandrium_andersonii.AAC.1